MFLRRIVFCKNTTYIFARFLSTKILNEHRIILTDNGSTFVAWHPPNDFPYNCTKPLPIATKDDTSILKTKFTAELMETFKKKTPEQARQKLMDITYTTKHRWFPRSRDKKAKKTPMDREYL